MSSIPPPPPSSYSPAAPPVSPLQLTGKGKRFGAFLLEALLMLVTLFVGWLIWSFIIWGKGQTPAKQLLKMRVVMADSYRSARWGDMALRELVGKLVLGMVPLYHLVSAVFVLADDRSQGIWDKIAKTVVVDDPDNIFSL